MCRKWKITDARSLNYYETCAYGLIYIQCGPIETGLFLRVDNFATVRGRKACDMS